jgi:hypothetical protein
MPGPDAMTSAQQPDLDAVARAILDANHYMTLGPPTPTPPPTSAPGSRPDVLTGDVAQSREGVEALDLTVGLRTIRAGPLRFDSEGFALFFGLPGVAPRFFWPWGRPT